MRRSFLIIIMSLLVLTACQSSTKGIGEKEAVDIALKHASVHEEDTSMLRVKKDEQDKGYKYIITFVDDTNTYEYVVGSNGDIFESERNSSKDVKKHEGSVVVDDNTFNEEAAFKKALEHAGVAEEDAMILKIEKDLDDQVFDIEFRTETSNYEYEIGYDGQVLDYEKENYYDSDIVYTRPTYYYTGATRYYYSGPTRHIDPSKIISDQEAIKIALDHAQVSQDDTSITKMERDSHEYEIDFVSGNYRYQYEIAFDGTVIKTKKKLR